MLRIKNKDQAAVKKAMDAGYSRLSLSQFGEDQVLLYFLKDSKSHLYVDIGCNHPHRYSNTYLLHHFRGWHGLNVDLSEDLIQLFNSDRKDCVNVRAAVSDRTDPIEIAYFEDDAVNSIDPGFIERQSKIRKIVRREIVTPKALAQIMAQHPQFYEASLLSIDVEGVDLSVLRSNNWDLFSPPFILVETGPEGVFSHSSPIVEFLAEKGYKPISQMVITTLFAYRGLGR